MSNNSESSSKRKRERRSTPEPEELRRSARQKGKNQLPIIQRAMNLKRANSLESDSLNSTQNRSQANHQTNLVQPTLAAVGQHINQSGSLNVNSNYDQTTMGHIHNINERRTSCLNPLAPEFRSDLSNNYPLQNYVESSRYQQPIMTDASRRINHSCTAGLCRSNNQAAQPVQSVPSIASLNSQMMSSDNSRRVIRPFNLYNEAPRPSNNAQIRQNMEYNMRASLFHQMLLSQHDASRRVIQSQMAGFHQSINQAAQPVQFIPSIAASNSQTMSSDASQRVIHPVMANSCNLSSEAPQLGNNAPVNQNLQALLQIFSSQRGAPQHRQSSSYPTVDPSPNAIPVNQRYPTIGADSFQRNANPVSDFVAREFNIGNRHSHRDFRRLDNFSTSNSQMNYPLSGDRTFALINSVNPDTGSHSSENNSSNNGRSLSSILHSEYDAKTQLELEAEFRRSLVIQDQPQSMTEPNNLMTTNSLDSRKRQNNAKRVKHAHKKEKHSMQPVITDHIRMEGGNPLSQSPPPPKPLGVRCQLCKIDLAFKAKGSDPQSSELPFSAVLPCRHAFHDQCLKDLFGDTEPPCVECLDSQVPRGC